MGSKWMRGMWRVPRYIGYTLTRKCYQKKASRESLAYHYNASRDSDSSFPAGGFPAFYVHGVCAEARVRPLHGKHQFDVEAVVKLVPINKHLGWHCGELHGRRLEVRHRAGARNRH